MDTFPIILSPYAKYKNRRRNSLNLIRSAAVRLPKNGLLPILPGWWASHAQFPQSHPERGCASPQEWAPAHSSGVVGTPARNSLNLIRNAAVRLPKNGARRWKRRSKLDGSFSANTGKTAASIVLAAAFPFSPQLPVRNAAEHNRQIYGLAGTVTGGPLSYFISVTMTAFCAWRRFSASSKISCACASNTSAVISSPRWAGRQCCTIQPGFAAANSAPLT